MKTVDDDDFADILAALDESLADGTKLSEARESPKDPRLASAREVLQFLEGVWPRGKSVAPTNLPNGFSRFRLLRVLGTGGFGIVYLAEDSRLGREVALKMPRPEVLVTPTLRERFIREARAVAQLHHANIVPIYDSGEIGAYCFLVSAYCSGGSLWDWLKTHENLLSVKAAAQLIAILADAVHHAHQRGILHRDLKPANILLTPVTDSVQAMPEFPFSPHIADFGLAKVTQETNDEGDAPTLTRSGALVGTPAYMAPEQAHGKNESVTIAVDVYALGAILYELLTRQAPFQANSHLDMLRQVVESEPVPPRQRRREIPRDLEAICLKCLEKRPERRYADASALSRDLRRFLEDKPTVARPLNVAQRAAKAVRRRPVASTFFAAFVIVMLTAIGGVTWHLGQLEEFNRKRAAAEKREEDLTKKARESDDLAAKRDRQVRLQSYVTHVSAADSFMQKKRFELALEFLADQKPTAKEEDLRDFAWRYLWHLGRSDWPIMRLRKEPVLAVQFSTDGNTLYSAHLGHWVESHDAFGGKSYGANEFSLHMSYPHSFRFSRGGQRIAVHSHKDNQIHRAVFETASQRRLFHDCYDDTFFSDCQFSPDGERLVFCDSRETFAVCLLEIKTQKVSRILELKGHHLRALSFAPDGESVAAVFEKENTSKFAIHHFRSGKNQFVAAGAPGYRQSAGLIWSPDGRTLVCSSYWNNLAILDAQPLKFRKYLKFPDGVHGFAKAFSRDGKYISVIASKPEPKRGRVHVLRTSDWQMLPQTFESRSPVHSVEWSPTENLLAVGGDNENIYLWNPFGPPAERILPGHQPEEAWGVAFSPDSKTLASAGDDHALHIWDPITGERLAKHVGHSSLASCLAYAPNGKWIATGSYDRSVRLWDAAKPTKEIHRFNHKHDLRCVAFSHDSKLLASAGRDKVVRLWNPTTGKDAGILAGHSGTVRSLAFHPKQNLLASAGDDRRVRIWDSDKKTLLHTLPHSRDVWSLAFSPDGNTIATGSADGSIAFWNVADATLRAIVYRHAGGVRSLAFSPDGKTLASGSEDKTVRLFNHEIHQELFAFPVQTHEVNGVAFSPDGTFLAAALHDATIAVWHAPK